MVHGKVIKRSRNSRSVFLKLIMRGREWLSTSSMLMFVWSLFSVMFPSLSPSCESTGAIRLFLRNVTVGRKRWVGCLLGPMVAMCAACSEPASAPDPERRIVSLSPVASEYVIALDAVARVVAVDASSRSMARLGEKAVSTAATVEAYRPTLILTPLQSGPLGAQAAAWSQRGIEVIEVDPHGFAGRGPSTAALVAPDIPRIALLDACREGEKRATGSPHPDNVAPSLMGGFVACVPHYG